MDIPQKVQPASGSRSARDKILFELRRELIGPSEPDELIRGEYPTSRYIVGRLAPAKSDVDDIDAQISQEENEIIDAGDEDSETSGEEQVPTLIVGFNPASIGLSFLIADSIRCLDVEISWGDYKRMPVSGENLWQRYPREGVVCGVPVSSEGKIPSIPLSHGEAPESVVVNGITDPDIFLEGVVHTFSGYTAVSLFLVNRRPKGSTDDHNKDERWIYQPSIRVTHHDGSPIFVSKDSASPNTSSNIDREELINDLLYRDAREFATGHGVAAGWDHQYGDMTRAVAVYTDYIPAVEAPQLIPPANIAAGSVLDMKSLAEVEDPIEISLMLTPLVENYEKWIDSLDTLVKSGLVGSNEELSDAARQNIASCRKAAERIMSGISLLREENDVFEAFKFANRAMWDQRIHSIWASNNRKTGVVSGDLNQYDISQNRTWRSFQMGFILLNLRGIFEQQSEDRGIVDLLWFPTGGGKTEAYLGLAAFSMALRRLRGNQHGCDCEAGVSVIMRYTLRLLTVQQFQRATALICACEVIRMEEVGLWGREKFSIGLWVGRSTTPNRFSESKQALDDIRDGYRPTGGSPVQFVSCPRCGTPLVDERGKPKEMTYLNDTSLMRTKIFCTNTESCEFAPKPGSKGSGLPVIVVDSEIYRVRPTIIIATVDKFARMPFTGETQALFGYRSSYSPTYGHLTEAHDGKVEGRVVQDSTPADRLLPPDLIIQDELHLISGPLGTMVGLYESAVDFLATIKTSSDTRLRPKIVASTATIRRASHQVRQLFSRRLSVFPPSGLTSRDSFFAQELKIDPSDDLTAGRLFVGAIAPGSSTKTLLVRIYSVLLAAAQAEIKNDANSADPFGTLVGYFNSMKALGGAKRLVEDDIALTRLKYLNRQRGFPYRSIQTPQELTSRVDSWRIPGLLKKLAIEFPRGEAAWPVDVLLATNMISVGVDIDRLGLMVVLGQPKSTSEYIQATSRVGRKHPGLIITMYNWLSVRDLSHYERFHSYHSALYRYVEAISVTPFSSRALDRGLRGVFTAMNRLAGNFMSRESDASNFDPDNDVTKEITDELTQRAGSIMGIDTSEAVRLRLLSCRDEWADLASDPLIYKWYDSNRRPKQNQRVLLRTAGTDNEGIWSTPGSLREVEPTAAFFLNEEEF